MMAAIYIDTALSIRSQRRFIASQQRYADSLEAALDRMERDGQIDAELMAKRGYLSTPQEDRDAVISNY